jgi:putative addiction module component (TIGR02574 family)
MASLTKEQILDAINEAEYGELTAEQRNELDKRLEAYRRDSSIAIPWDKVKARLTQELRSIRGWCG